MAIGGVQRLVTLPPAPESARRARRFVGDVLRSAAADELIDTAELLTSELVTNGIVHAHTDLQLIVEATARWVRVEVVDRNPLLPARRSYDDDALTGRGLEMVALLADEFGMQPLADAGKRVWFRLGESPFAPVEETDTLRVRDTVSVHLINLPLTLYSAWQAHAEAMLREATLVALDGADRGATGEFALANQALSALAAATVTLLERRDVLPAHVDVEVVLPRLVVPNFPVLRDVLRRCSDRAAAGELLVPWSLPEIQAVRRWVCDEVGRQTQDLPPRPWAEIDVDDVPVEPTSADLVDRVRATAAACVAADRWNRIIALSDSASRLLGWPRPELEGQRLVVIVPPALRDAHVAGFTRQLLGGAPRLVGEPVQLPALRRDGSEILVTMRLERELDTDGHPVFVATLSPGAE